MSLSHLSHAKGKFSFSSIGPQHFAPVKSKILISNNEAEVDLKEDEIGISPGQACVFYSKNINGYKVLGGGWITKN